MDDKLTSFVQLINSYLWGICGLIPLLVGVGIYFTFRLRFVQIRKFITAVRFTLSGASFNGKRAGKSGMSSFQSLATAVAAQVGTGNIAGAATAVTMGGPGAIFWMWIAAFFGMATIFTEAVLAQLFKSKDHAGNITGGPSYYITNGLHCKPLAIFFSCAVIIALGLIGNMVQSNSIASAFTQAFDVPPIVTGIIVAAIAAFVFIGGVGRIASTTEKIVPIMALVYIVGSLIVIFINLDQFIPAIKSIFVGAFNPSAATGGVIGATVKEAMRYGVARGLFSNEAGMGSTPHAHAVARVDHPVEQGLVAICGLFLDTFIVLNMTAFVIFTTGVLDGKTTGIELAQKAFSTGFGSTMVGGSFVAVCLLFFAFSTIVGWYFFAAQNVKFLFGTKSVKFYVCIVLLFLVLGSVLKVNLVWELADLFNGLMVIPNLIALLGLGALVSKALKDFEGPRELADSNKETAE